MGNLGTFWQAPWGPPWVGAWSHVTWARLPKPITTLVAPGAPDAPYEPGDCARSPEFREVWGPVYSLLTWSDDRTCVEACLYAEHLWWTRADPPHTVGGFAGWRAEPIFEADGDSDECEITIGDWDRRSGPFEGRHRLLPSVYAHGGPRA
jgi:hypothetical protein